MRAPIVIEAKDPNGNYIPNAVVTIRNRASGSYAFLYENESGGGRENNPLVTDASGRAVSWAERGVYIASVTGYGITPYDVPIDTTPAGDGSIDPLWLPRFPYRSKTNTLAETTTSTTFTSLSTPDDLTDVIIPQNSAVGILITYLGKSSTTTAGTSALYVNGVRGIKFPFATGAPFDFGGTVGVAGNANIYGYHALHSISFQATGTSSDYAVETTTGQAQGSPGAAASAGFMWFWVPDAGLYDFSMRFAAPAGATITVKERRLWVWVLG